MVSEEDKKKAQILARGFSYEPIYKRRENGKLLCHSCQQYPSGCFCKSEKELEKINEIAEALAEERKLASEKYEKEIEQWKQAEHKLSNAYIRIRKLINAFDTPFAPTAEQVWEHTENRIKELVEALDKIASWKEGEVVNGSFDEPCSARIARAALSKHAKEPLE